MAILQIMKTVLRKAFATIKSHTHNFSALTKADGRLWHETWCIKKYNYLQYGRIKKQNKKTSFFFFFKCTCYNPVEKFRKKMTKLPSTFEETWTLLLFYRVNEQEWNGEVQTASKAETTTANMTWALFKHLHRKHNTKQVVKILEWY